MRLPSPLGRSLAVGLSVGFSVARANYLVSELSFGYGGRYVALGDRRP